MLEIKKYIKKHVGRKILLTLTFSPSPSAGAGAGEVQVHATSAATEVARNQSRTTLHPEAEPSTSAAINLQTSPYSDFLDNH